MATAVDVMRYIKSQIEVRGEVQLLKLVYYSQAWNLAWDGVPLFPERVEAWRLGPVVPAIYKRSDPADDSVLTSAERATVDAVLTHYGEKYGNALSQQTHDEKPWQDAWANGEGDNWGKTEITHEAMRRFYTEQAIGREGPTRRSVRSVVDDAELRQVAAVNTERWQSTLAILAQ
jgi:uncharacterized phage-associated protein